MTFHASDRLRSRSYVDHVDSLDHRHNLYHLGQPDYLHRLDRYFVLSGIWLVSDPTQETCARILRSLDGFHEESLSTLIVHADRTQ